MKSFQLLYGMIYICADSAFIKLIHINNRPSKSVINNNYCIVRNNHNSYTRLVVFFPSYKRKRAPDQLSLNQFRKNFKDR